MFGLHAKVAVTIALTLCLSGPGLADTHHDHASAHGELASVSFADYMAQVRVLTNANRELPDLNLGGWRALTWGSVVDLGQRANAVASADATVMSVRRTIRTTSDGRLAGVAWRGIGDTSDFDGTLATLASVYGLPSETHIDGTRVWRGTHSVLVLGQDERGVTVTLSPATQP